MYKAIENKCTLILEAIVAIEQYKIGITSPQEFKRSDKNNIHFDAIVMRLQTIGKNVKKVNKVDQTFFDDVLMYDVNNLVRFRDFISHHYEKLDTDIVFDIVENDIPNLKVKIITFLAKK